MPKVHGTRKHKASDLYRTLLRGPSLSLSDHGGKRTEQEAERQVRGWIDSWIIARVEELIPELRDPDMLKRIRDKIIEEGRP